MEPWEAFHATLFRLMHMQVIYSLVGFQGYLTVVR